MKQESFDPLLEYTKFVVGGGLLRLRPPKNSIYVNTVGLQNDKVVSLILDRQGRFQTELFIFATKGAVVQGHTHPGVDSNELAVAGEFTLKMDGKDFIGNANGQPIADNAMVSVPEDLVHGGIATNGACFLSFQHWKIEDPTTIGNSFIVKE